MVTYVLIGPKGQRHADCLTNKGKSKSRLLRVENDEIKKEFKAPSWEVASIVYEVYNGWIPDVDQFLQDITKYYGYKLEKINGPSKVARTRK
jgi:hypothetical protein